MFSYGPGKYFVYHQIVQIGIGIKALCYLDMKVYCEWGVTEVFTGPGFSADRDSDSDGIESNNEELNACLDDW